MNQLKTFTVIGSGSWGTAIASHLARMYDSVILYSNSKKTVNEINSQKTNSKYLDSIILPNNLIATNKLEKALYSEVIFIAVPSYVFSSLLEKIKKYNIPLTSIFIIATKGISSNPIEMLSETFSKNFLNPFAFFYGPNLAKEVASEKLSSVTIASQNITLAHSLSCKLANQNLKISTTEDIITVQISSMIKNIIAIKSGIWEATENTENTKAWFLTQALQEISYISSIMGGKVETLLEPGVVGDLILTNYSKKSRNLKFGLELHKNKYSENFILSYQHLVEGLEAIRLIEPFLLKYNIKLSDLPVINSIVTNLNVRNKNC